MESKVKLLTVNQHNKAVIEKLYSQAIKGYETGVACPDCGCELVKCKRQAAKFYDVSDGFNKVRVFCKCGFHTAIMQGTERG
jgi:hypothetical protein